MPPGYVKNIEEEIFYEYAKLISRSVFSGQINYRFVSDRFKALRNGEINMSGTIREWQREQELPKECVFCSTEENLEADHLIPRNRGGSDAADNVVLACITCNTSRGDQGVYQWLGLEKKDNLHRLVAGKYLKELYDLHVLCETLWIDKDNLIHPEPLSTLILMGDWSESDQSDRYLQKRNNGCVTEDKTALR